MTGLNPVRIVPYTTLDTGLVVLFFYYFNSKINPVLDTDRAWGTRPSDEYLF